MPEASGIDRASSVEDVQAAFRQLGAELRMVAAGDGWEARVVTQGDEQVFETGREPADLARAAWAEFVRRNEGTGES
jgi:hypothetical protein